METYTYTARADLPAEDLFEALRERREVARCLPWIEIREADDGTVPVVTADPPGGERGQEAWLRTDEGTRTVHWGTSDDGYRGELRVSGQGPDRCEVAVTLTTGYGTGELVRTEMEEAVAALTHTATAETDVQGARGQKGWA